MQKQMANCNGIGKQKMSKTGAGKEEEKEILTGEYGPRKVSIFLLKLFFLFALLLLCVSMWKGQQERPFSKT
jgi:hypothetical protein